MNIARPRSARTKISRTHAGEIPSSYRSCEADSCMYHSQYSTETNSCRAPVCATAQLNRPFGAQSTILASLKPRILASPVQTVAFRLGFFHRVGKRRLTGNTSEGTRAPCYQHWNGRSGLGIFLIRDQAHSGSTAGRPHAYSSGQQGRSASR